MSDYKKTILAIDDDITVLTTIRSILERSYDVSLAKNTSIAKNILDRTMVDMILLDMDMPGMSGMDFLETIHSDDSYYSVPVIIVSSYGTANVILEAKKRGAIDFLVKPISPKILLEKIQYGFKFARSKISKIGLARKLQLLENACMQGKSIQIDKCIKDMDQYCLDLKTDTEIAEICKYAKEMDYNLVEDKIRNLMAELSE